MADIGHGHIIGKPVGAIPLQITVKDARAKSSATEAAGPFVNACCGLQELLMVVIEMTVVQQVVDIDFEATISDAR